VTRPAQDRSHDGAPPAQARRAPLVIGRADAMAGAAGALGRRGDTSCAAAVTPSSSASSRAGTQPRRCAPAQRSGAAGARERGGARAHLNVCARAQMRSSESGS